MKNIIYTIIFLLLPPFGWAQFEDFIKLSFTEEESTDALRYDVYGCNPEMKVVITRHSTDGGTLIVNFKNYEDKSLEKVKFGIGNNHHYKVVPMNRHLLILVGEEHKFLLKHIWTKTIAISYSDFTVHEIGEDVSKGTGKYNATEDNAFMSSFVHENYDLEQYTDIIALRYDKRLYLLNLEKNSLNKLNLTNGKSKDEYTVLRIIASQNREHIHVFARYQKEKNIILKLNQRGNIIKSTTINDENLGKTMFLRSLGFYEENDTYFICGITKKLNGADGLKTISIEDDKVTVKSYGFTDKKLRSLEENIKGKTVRTSEGGSCKVILNQGKKYAVITYLKSESTGSVQYEVVTNINALEIEGNKIVGSIPLSAEDINGRLFNDYKLIFDNSKNQIIGINSTKAGVTQVIFNFDNNTGKSLNIFDGLTWSHNIISNNQIFIYGLFKDGEPYQMQMKKKKDKGSYYATGLLEF